MRTARALTVSRGGVYLGPGGTCPVGGSTYKGVPVGGSTCWGWGEYLPEGVGGYLPGGGPARGVPAQVLTPLWTGQVLPPRGQTDACKLITLPQTSFAGGNNCRVSFVLRARSCGAKTEVKVKNIKEKMTNIKGNFRFCLRFRSLYAVLKLCSHLTFAFVFTSTSPSSLTLCQWKRKNTNAQNGSEPILDVFHWHNAKLDGDVDANVKCEHSLKGSITPNS